MPTAAGPTTFSEPPTRLTALYHKHVALGAKLESRHSWLVPVSYAAPGREAAAIQHGIGLIDIGDIGKIDVKSSDLDAVLAAVLSQSTPLPVNATEVMNDSLRVCRLTRDQALLFTTPSAFQEIFDRLHGIADTITHTHLTDLTGALCGLRLLGPNASFLLERLTSVDLAPDRFADGALAQCGLARVHAIVLRRDAAGILGYDLFVDRDLGAYLWDSLLETGAPLGIAPVGRGAEKETV
jgi:aminomethyltransferase